MIQFHKTVTLGLFAALILTGTTKAQNKNSTRKVRIQPTEFSGQCGSAVQWRDSVEDAIEESAKSGKPVFWYVPTIGGSFMDRKPVIDQYMMAGPFSWPSIAKLVNENYIPVKSVANRDLQRRFEQLVRYKFVEPGFVILNSEGDLQKAVDQLTTLDPHWISSLLANWAAVETPPLWSDKVNALAEQIRKNNIVPVDEFNKLKEGDAEALLLRGMILFGSGDHAEANKAWLLAAKKDPEHPLAWKAAAEAENWGPFVRGFERLVLLPEEAYKAGVNSRGSMSPANVYTKEQLWVRSIQFLLAMQNEQGGWVDSDYDFGGTDSLPNVYVAVSALCGNAILQYLENPKTQTDEPGSPIRDAVERAASYCIDRNNMNFDDSDEILWAHAFRARFLARLVKHSEEYSAKYASALQQAVTDLESVQSKRGAWYHEYPNSFVTATALTALKLAADAGAVVDEGKIKRGVVALANDRFDNGAYPYSSESRQRKRNTRSSSGRGKIPASSGRMPICELGLWQWGASDDERLQFALKSAFENHKHLAISYKYDNHTDTMAYGGFFFWYDMRSRAEALTFMKAGDDRTEFAKQHQNLILALPELDGCFVDSHELGRCYGTAMALLSLSLLDEIK